MEDTVLHDLGERIECMQEIDPSLVADALAAMKTVLSSGLQTFLPDTPALGSTDAILLLVDAALPGWSVTIEGSANMKNGHWTCVLRNEDADARIGIGKGPVLSHALYGGLMKVLAHK